MFSIHEHLKKKRAPIDKWAIKEQLCLASAVVRSGDQNWTSVSRALKPFHELSRPADWFSQKNCAAQYGLLLETVDTPKRKKRTTGADPLNDSDTPQELIRKKLTEERINELRNNLDKEKNHYQKLVGDLKLLRSGNANEAKLRSMYNEIVERHKQKEVDKALHAQWLKEREEKKLDLERVWRPPLKLNTSVPVLKRNSENLDSEVLVMEEPTTPEPNLRPSTSPLLTSLLKSPSPAPNPSLLHSAIRQPNNSQGLASMPLTQLTGTTPESQPPSASAPTLSKLLEKPAGHLISPTKTHAPAVVVPASPMVLPDLSDKNESIEKVIAEIKQDIENFNPALAAQDILSFGNVTPFGAVNANSSMLSAHKDVYDDMSMDETLTEVDNIIRQEQEKEKELEMLRQQNIQRQIPDIRLLVADNVENLQESSLMEQTDVLAASSPKIGVIEEDMIKVEAPGEDDTVVEEVQIKKEVMDTVVVDNAPSRDNDSAPGSVEVVEVMFMDDDDSDKESRRLSDHRNNLEMSKMVSNLRKECGLDRSIEEQTSPEDEEDDEDEDTEGKKLSEVIDSIVKGDTLDSSSSQESNDGSVNFETNEKSIVEEVIEEPIEEKQPSEIKQEPLEEDVVQVEQAEEVVGVTKPVECAEPVVILEKVDSEDLLLSYNKEELPQSVEEDHTVVDIKEEIVESEITIYTEPTGSIDTDDDTPIEVIKEDKQGKTKRDYSRKKNEEKPPKQEEEEPEVQKKTEVTKFKARNDERRSESPWTEEEEPVLNRSRRGYSMSMESIPNSPAPGTTLTEDEKEHRAWKKSVMLVYSRLCTHRYASFFNKPITDDQAPRYHSIIKCPMDLSTIKKHLDSGIIRTTAEFQRAVLLMFQNAVMYNRSDTLVYTYAVQMQQEAVQQLEMLVQAQAQGEATARRETRTSEPGLRKMAARC